MNLINQLLEVEGIPKVSEDVFRWRMPLAISTAKAAGMSQWNRWSKYLTSAQRGEKPKWSTQPLQRVRPIE